MVYDPNNPNPQIPDGMAAITSVPGGAGMPQTNPGGRVAPVPGGAPASPGFSMPNLPTNIPGGFQMPSIPGLPAGGGGLTPGGMPPVPGAPGGGLTPPARPGGMPSVGGGGFANGGQFNIDGLRAFIDNYKNALFQWLSTRPQDQSGMADWRTARPQFDPQGLMAAMFAPPPAPAPAPAPAPVI